MTRRSFQSLCSSGKAEKTEVGSGNVFADLGLPNAEARLAKAMLATRIAQSIERNSGAKHQITERTGLEPAELSRLLRGQLSGFSTLQLFAMLSRLEFNG
jgi:predicted XRE-type DNA-binding protein